MDLGKAAGDALSGALGGTALGPFGMLAGALMGAVPDLIGVFAPHLAGPRSEAVAQAVVSAVSAATGIEQPKPADIKALPPEQLSDLQIGLAQIAMQAEAHRLEADKAARDADMQELAARLGDTANARAQMIALAQAHAGAAWAPVVITALVLSGFIAVTVMVLTRSVPAGSEQAALLVVGALIAMATQSVNFWTGSSNSSQKKDRDLAASVPASLVNALAQGRGAAQGDQP
jgi:hypothetical protein